MIIEKEAFGSLLQIHTFEQNLSKDRIELCFNTVSLFEQQYSRFISHNFLNTLNKTGKAQASEELKYLVKVAKKVWEESGGYFDITLLPILENNGYGIAKNILCSNTGMENIEIIGDSIILKNGVQIDLGGIGKGYMIDTLFGLLNEDLERFMINFGGDIRVKGNDTIGLEDPFDTKKLIGEIYIENGSICGSSGQKRKIKKGHHIINPKSLESQQDKIAVFCVHEKAIYSDIYATTLFAAPLNKALNILEKTNGLEALIISSKGEIFKSKGFNCILY